MSWEHGDREPRIAIFMWFPPHPTRHRTGRQWVPIDTKTDPSEGA